MEVKRADIAEVLKSTANSKRTRCEVWTRVMGYHRPVSHFNTGKNLSITPDCILVKD